MGLSISAITLLLFILEKNRGHEVYFTKIKTQLNSLMYSKIALKS